MRLLQSNATGKSTGKRGQRGQHIRKKFVRVYVVSHDLLFQEIFFRGLASLRLGEVGYLFSALSGISWGRGPGEGERLFSLNSYG